MTQVTIKIKKNNKKHYEHRKANIYMNNFNTSVYKTNNLKEEV